MRNIIVGTDLSARSDRAMGRAALLARQFGAALHIVHIIDNELPRSVVDLHTENIQGLLARQIASGNTFEGVDTSVHLLLGDPTAKMLEFAGSKAADLVVLGTHRARGLLDRFGGTTVARIASSSGIPTLMVSGRDSEAYGKPVVGVDFSECSKNAAVLAAKIVPEQPLTFVSAYNIPYKNLTTEMTLDGELSMRDILRAEAELKTPIKDFEAALSLSQSFEWVLVEGGPSLVLDREARRVGADLLCVGPHARSWIAKAMLGSTTEKLLADPPCDVLVAPL